MVEGIIRASDLLWSSTPDAETDMSSVRVIRADDAYSEMDFIAAEIKRLISEEGYRYSEIAVLCSSPKDHRSPAESAFAKYDIPVFCDIPESILNTPLTNLILSLLKAIDEPNAENLLSYVRSSFLRVKDEDGKFRALSLADIDSFDGYIFRWQIHGDQLQQEFTTDKMGRDDQAQAERAESVRESAVVPVILLRDEIIEKKRAGDAPERGSASAYAAFSLRKPELSRQYCLRRKAVPPCGISWWVSLRRFIPRLVTKR